jgi:hydroxyethylthiazole kinase-like uncharacterized protein yjeF
MSSNSELILGHSGPIAQLRLPLFTSHTTRQLEMAAVSTLPPHSLMQRAGLALAQLAMAYAPHARTFWIACGRGNNGGDGLEAAMHLQRWGKAPIVTLMEGNAPLPADAAASLRSAQDAGVQFATQPPQSWDICIDALLGIGLRMVPAGATLQCVQTINRGTGTVIAADVPSGLQADSGHAPGEWVHADATLSFLTLKPGLFTAHGRDACGDIWFNTLGVTAPNTADAWLNAPPPHTVRSHASHKGSYGDVAIVGGAPGMAGAAILAASAALHGGAGRVYLSLLDATGQNAALAQQPELMPKHITHLNLANMAVVAGCGGGADIAQHLPRILQQSGQLALDADALNVLAANPQWQRQVASRQPGTTVLTPHPLEAARLLDCSSGEVQADRIACAQNLAQRFQCTVVLKGSGSLIAAPGKVPCINPSGNARLASAGTGDVLAGLLGSLMARGLPAFDAACEGVYRHGLAANLWHAPASLTASLLARNI